jgi:hypothetical protein
LLLAACSSGAEGESAPFVYNNNIFPKTATLAAAASPMGSSVPNLSWPATGEPFVVAAFFVHRIDVASGIITNVGDLVWIWHTGLPTGREGNVTWSQGVPAVGGELEEGTVPSPLPTGTYYWAVWALNESGVVVSSTVENVYEVQ